MKRIITNALILLAVAAIVVGCAHKSELPSAQGDDVAYAKHNSVYYWKTTFALDSTEQTFLQRHQIDRIYLRMFDVAVEHNYNTQAAEVVPIATTKFISSIPAGVEIVPVTYITIEALRLMRGKENEYAQLIVERLLAMCSYNECGAIEELQIDCDWTQTTESSYFILCDCVKQLLQKRGIALSVTIRLHQLCGEVPPVDRGVLMLYNTGTLKKYETRNSILDIKDVKIYVKFMQYGLPLDYAYPAFGWGVKFMKEEFVSIVSEQDTVSQAGEYIRKERPTYAEIVAVKKYVESHLGKPASGNILYHLDYSQLNNYTDDEINQILAY